MLYTLLYHENTLLTFICSVSIEVQHALDLSKPEPWDLEPATLVEGSSTFAGIGPSVAKFGDENQVLIIWFSMVVIMLCYSGVSVFGCLNTCRYVVK